MFGIRGVIMMLDLWMNGCVGDNFVGLSEVVITVDMLLRKSKLVTSQCALNTRLIGKRTLGIVLRLWENAVDVSVMATISEFHPSINLQKHSLLRSNYSGYIFSRTGCTSSISI